MHKVENGSDALKPHVAVSQVDALPLPTSLVLLDLTDCSQTEVLSLCLLYSISARF